MEYKYFIIKMLMIFKYKFSKLLNNKLILVIQIPYLFLIRLECSISNITVLLIEHLGILKIS
jgi:hypothetical protein